MLGTGAAGLAGIGGRHRSADLRTQLVRPNDLSRVDAAFFTMNGYVSMLFFIFWAADISCSR